MRRRSGSADLTTLANRTSASGVSSWDTINLSGSPVHADTPETEGSRAANEVEASAARSPSLFTSEEIIRLNKSIDEAARKARYAKLEAIKKSDVVSSKPTREQQVALFADKIIFDGTYFTLKNIRLPNEKTNCHIIHCIGFYATTASLEDSIAEGEISRDQIVMDNLAKFQLLIDKLSEINQDQVGEEGSDIFTLEIIDESLMSKMSKAVLIQASDNDLIFTANPTDLNNLYEILYEEARKTYNEGLIAYKGNPSQLDKLEKAYNNFLTFLQEQHQAALDYLKLFHRLAEKPKAEAETRDVSRYAFRC
ncbi:MAG TPA: hypothetical protein VD770_02010 [Coxiellaceae bacterium]|nr:hypothetical protein [Coxiellaceae bacterium]